MHDRFRAATQMVQRVLYYIHSIVISDMWQEWLQAAPFTHSRYTEYTLYHRLVFEHKTNIYMERKWESTTQLNDFERTNYKSSYFEWFSRSQGDRIGTTEKFLQLSLNGPLNAKFPNGMWAEISNS